MITNRFKCVEIADLDQLLSKHDPTDRVPNDIQCRGPDRKPNHIRHDHQHYATHARLGRQPNLESKLSTVVVHPTAVHQAQHILDSFMSKNSLSCDWTDTTISQGARHHRHAGSIHLHRAGLK
eukprot:TRINITY_DN37637_c0_g1_i1.p1 TRINITY_DN37637_c0_g1~~TRINITY_DN37637_c0_g1_i1.p1  ORF type:complete len:123 (+),score=16.82 TRINITY_DN37637_c0_g1_i1:78-446(+)